MTEPAVSMTGVTKSFGGVVALHDISLDFDPGAVHALVGQNGAGKSTCLGILAGRLAATRGAVAIHGQQYPKKIRPHVARTLGVSAIYQELTVVPAMSAIDNVLLNTSVSRFGFLDRRWMRKKFAELSERLNVAISADTRGDELSVADQQMLEIMRALSVECRVLLMDEPTAALAQAERDGLFRVVHQLKQTGVTTFLVSHYLDEVLAESDSVTVFRDGRCVARRTAAAWEKDQLIASMLGNELGVLREAAQSQTNSRWTVSDSPGSSQSRTTELLRVEGLTSRHGIEEVSLVVRPGEIVGLGGLVGSGRTSLMRTLSGATPPIRGRGWLEGAPIRLPRSPHEAVRLGIRALPEDRKKSGIIPAMTSAENVIVGQVHKFARLSLVNRREVNVYVRQLATEYGIAPAILKKRASELSGGNQQKLLLARVGGPTARVLLADEPTRGIDIGAKAVILETLRRLADTGIGVIVASSDLEEIAAISDRIYVLREKRVVAELNSRTGTDVDQILKYAFGHSEDTHA
jgi:ABC-type sugar transport system ATPase subunit